MNILTKISVVVLLVLALFSSAVFISSAVIPDNYRTAWQNEQKKAELANQYAMNSMLALRRAQMALDKATGDLTSSRDESATQIRELTSKINDLTTKNGELNSQISVFGGEVTKLGAILKSEQEQRQAADELAKKLREELGQAHKEVAALTNQLQESLAVTGRMETTIRSYQVTIQDQKEQIERLISERGGKAVAEQGGVTDGTVSPAKITGKINGIQGDVASINVGSAKGIRPGMTLLIIRGDKLLAHLRIQQVDDSEAAGVIYDRQAEVQVGDVATTSVKL